MIPLYVRAVSSEWLKRRRSLTTWLVAGSAAFVPAIIFLSRFRRIDVLPALYRDPRFWELLWRQAWEAMALMILPLAVMLTVSLITQIEDRNNAWKQVHAAPVPLAVVFAAKLTVIVALVTVLVLLYTPAIYLAGILPALVLPSVPRPAAGFPLAAFLRRDVDFIVDMLPIVAIQFALALRFRTFLTPLAVGMATWIFSVGTISWRYSYMIPYSYGSLDYLMVEYHRQVPLPASPPVIASGCFVVFTLAGYVVYAARRDKG
jgi:lantibiotic transport system permease protein